MGASNVSDDLMEKCHAIKIEYKNLCEANETDLKRMNPELVYAFIRV